MASRRTIASYLVLFLSCGFFAAASSDNDQNHLQRRRKISEPLIDVGENKLFKDIWEAEAYLAEQEAERFLQSDIFMAPSFPPTPPPNPGPPTATPPPNNPGTSPPTSSSDDCLNGRTRNQYLFDQFSLITSPVLLSNPGTAQGRALAFMETDPLQPNVCVYPIDQRYGLATLYFSTIGANWLNQQNWLTGTSECNWFGITCLDGNLATNITLRNNNLVGPLPDEISTNYAMTQMLLSGNSITSTIPVGISNMTELCVLDLEMNLLEGDPIPGQILVLTNLKQLFLSENIFERETIPPDISLLSGLQDFWIATNGMTGPIPNTIGQLTDLKTLILSRNQFANTLPSEIGFLTDLTNLQIYENTFLNEIPEQLYGLQQLSVLRLNRNFFTGTISPNIGNLNQLTDLRMEENFFEGVVPFSLGQLSSLEIAAFSNNQLTGSIPNVFQNFENLQVIDFSTNGLNGPIPESLFQINALRLVYLYNNMLTGALPASYSNPPLLQDLFLNNNNLVGPVPAIPPGRLLQLNEFTLQANSFTGSMPTSVCNLRTNGNLDDLFADCGGPTPQLQCDFDQCCTRCFQD